MRLSIISTVYKSEGTIDEFLERATEAATKYAGDSYEIVIVNDGSPDGCLTKIIDRASYDSHIVVVDLSRNFGHHKAMMTGLQFARGEEVFLIDSDLEEDPAWLSSFSEERRQSGCDVVYGVQMQRKGGSFERWTGQWFYWVFNTLTRMQLPENVIVARLMTKRYVDSLVQHRERELFVAGLWVITGYDQKAVAVHKKHRGDTSYSLSMKFSLLANAITSFSNRPLYMIFYCGIAISIFSAAFTAYLIYIRLFNDTLVSGWVSVMASIWLIGGFIISFIGVIGIYLAKIFSEVKDRPYTVVRQVVRGRKYGAIGVASE